MEHSFGSVFFAFKLQRTYTHAKQAITLRGSPRFRRYAQRVPVLRCCSSSSQSSQLSTFGRQLQRQDHTFSASAPSLQSWEPGRGVWKILDMVHSCWKESAAFKRRVMIEPDRCGRSDNSGTFTQPTRRSQQKRTRKERKQLYELVSHVSCFVEEMPTPEACSGVCKKPRRAYTPPPTNCMQLLLCMNSFI